MHPLPIPLSGHCRRLKHLCAVALIPKTAELLLEHLHVA
jgi:hypothetical protein